VKSGPVNAGILCAAKLRDVANKKIKLKTKRIKLSFFSK
jgi:hypothetical protein